MEKVAALNQCAIEYMRHGGLEHAYEVFLKALQELQQVVSDFQQQQQQPSLDIFISNKNQEDGIQVNNTINNYDNNIKTAGHNNKHYDDYSNRANICHHYYDHYVAKIADEIDNPHYYYNIGDEIQDQELCLRPYMMVPVGSLVQRGEHYLGHHYLTLRDVLTDTTQLEATATILYNMAITKHQLGLLGRCNESMLLQAHGLYSYVHQLFLLAAAFTIPECIELDFVTMNASICYNQYQLLSLSFNEPVHANVQIKLLSHTVEMLRQIYYNHYYQQRQQRGDLDNDNNQVNITYLDDDVKCIQTYNTLQFFSSRVQFASLVDYNKFAPAA